MQQCSCTQRSQLPRLASPVAQATRTNAMLSHPIAVNFTGDTVLDASCARGAIGSSQRHAFTHMAPLGVRDIQQFDFTQ